MHRSDVQKLVPDLWDHMKRKTKGTTDFSLGSLDLHFRRPYLSSIRIQFSGGDVTLPSFVYQHQTIEEYPATHREFLAFLKNEAITYTKVLDKDDQIELALGNGVYVKFYEKRLLNIRRNPTAAESKVIEEKARATYPDKK